MKLTVLADMANEGDLISFETKTDANLWDEIDASIDGYRGPVTTFADVTFKLTEEQLKQATKRVIPHSLMNKMQELFDAGNDSVTDMADEVFGEYYFEMDIDL